MGASELAQRELSRTVDEIITQDGSAVRLRFEIDELKIDRSLIQTLADGHNPPIVAAIVAMAHALSILVVAEGIETRQQATEAHRLGCDRGQGFFFAAPCHRPRSPRCSPSRPPCPPNPSPDAPGHLAGRGRNPPLTSKRSLGFRCGRPAGVVRAGRGAHSERVVDRMRAR